MGLPDRSAADGGDEHSGLQATVEALERELARHRELLREAQAASRSQASDLKRLQRAYDAMRSRRAVRLALAASAAVRPFTRGARKLASAPRRAMRVMRELVPGRSRGPNQRGSAAAERTLVAEIRACPPPTVPDRGPVVSIVILNRDGWPHLERCLRGIASTAYQDVEVIVVDNGSSDGSADLAERLSLPFPMQVLRNDTNRSFSEANAQGIAAAHGDVICLLNNDVDPITDHWLGYLVETLTTTDAVAVGARLIYPRGRGGARAGARFADLSLQHRGVAFDRTGPIPMPRVMGAGEDPMAPVAAGIHERPALTAACVLIRRQAFDAAGGFSAEYDYGLEDIDLCLRLRAGGGRLLYDGRAALWHHESATRIIDVDRYKARVANNRATFVGRWGPRIAREVLLDAIDGAGRWSEAPLRVGIAAARPDADAGPHPTVLPGAVQVALGGLGWQVAPLGSVDPDDVAGSPKDADTNVLIVLADHHDIRLLPRPVVTIAVIDGLVDPWLARPWFDEFDIVLVTSPAAAEAVRAGSAKVASVLPDGTAHSGDLLASEIRDALAAWVAAIRYGVRIPVPTWDVAEGWGDYHFARALQRALERAGHPTRLHLRPGWDDPVTSRDDVNVQLLGRTVGPTRPGQVNLLWQISHPEAADGALYSRFDHVFVASDRFAATMASRTEVPVEALHQATDPERFHPEPGGPHHELLFVGNTRGVRRKIVDDLAGTKHELAVYGRGWDAAKIDPTLIKGERIPNAVLRRYYSAASIVLNDHWEDMRTEGFMSNRLYDALACGAFVISDFVEGIEAEFGGAVATYRERHELTRLVDRYLADPDERRRLAEVGRPLVLERHTFDARAAALRVVADELLARRSSRIVPAEPA